MRPKDPANPRASMWDLMGYYLRHLRTSRGATGADAAAAMGVAASTISRIETGEQRLTEKNAEKIDEKWRTGGLFALLLYYARRASDPDWFKTFVFHEKQARKIRLFAGQIVPGLVQTVDYARALLEAGRDPDVERSLARRMARQEVLSRAKPPDLWIYLTENVLDWVVGGKDVHRAQLARLLELADLPHVVVRVVRRTSGAGEWLDGPYMIITNPDGEVAFVEAPKAGRLVTDADEVEDFKDRFERIGAQALPVDSSKELIKEIMEGL